MDLHFAMAIRGNLRQLEQGHARAVTGAVRGTVAQLKNSGRRQIRARGLGNRLANAWRGKVLSSSGEDITKDGIDANPVGIVYSSAVYKRNGRFDLIDVFNRGITVKAKDGTYMEVPTPAAGGRKAKRSSEYPDGTFRYIPVGRKGRGRRRANSVAYVLVHKARGEVWFLWIATVRIKKRLNLDSLFRTAMRGLDRRYARLWARELQRAGVVGV